MTTTNQVEVPKSTKDSLWIFVLFAAVVVRGSVLFISLSTFDDDPDNYAHLAENWRVNGVFGEGTRATAFRPPLYPWLLKEFASLQARGNDRANARANNKLAQVLSNFALSRQASTAFCHWLLGVGTVLLVYRLTLLLGLSERASAFASLLVIVDPILLQQSRLVMTETTACFFSTFILVLVSISAKRRFSKVGFLLYLITGVVLGLSTLCRPAFFAFVGLIFFGLVALEIYDGLQTQRQKESDQKRSIFGAILRLLLFSIGTAIVVLPWGLRNYREFGVPILTTTHGGYTLYLANNPELYKHYENSPYMSLWDPRQFHRIQKEELHEAMVQAAIPVDTKEAELFQDRWYRDNAFKTISNNIPMFLRSCVERCGELWRLTPNKMGNFIGNKESALRLGIEIFYAVEFFFVLLALLCVVVSRTDKTRNAFIQSSPINYLVVFWGMLLILSVQIPHLFYWTNMRMRAPIQTVIPIFAVLGMSFVYKRFFVQSKKSL